MARVAQDVVGLDVAVDDSVLVAGVQGVDDAVECSDACLGGEWSFVSDDVPQCSSGVQGYDEEGDVLEGSHVRDVDRGGGVGADIRKTGDVFVQERVKAVVFALEE